MTFDRVWRLLDGQVAAGRFPGYVAALRIGERSEVRAGGRTAAGPHSPATTEDSLFRIASVTKPIGAALVLGLVRDGALELDDPVERWLPEAAHPRVLADPGGSLDHTVEAQRPITVRHLLTLTCGWGAVLGRSPLQAAMIERAVYPGPAFPFMSADEFVTRVTGLPLAFQPGEGWLYHTGIDLLGVLLVRATGTSLSQLVRERITGPLAMSSTSFGASDASRLVTAYRPEPGGLVVSNPRDGVFAGQPEFEALGSGLVSTAGDVLRFFTALADGGAPVAAAGSVALMTSDALDDRQRRQALPIVGPGASWGMGCAVDLEAFDPWMAPGRWGWSGGTGTSAYVDPVRNTVAVLLTQREMTGPLDRPTDFWTAVAETAAH